jgi:hypothetical protein
MEWATAKPRPKRIADTQVALSKIAPTAKVVGAPIGFQLEVGMYSIRYGIDLSVETLEVETAREALLTAEEFFAADRPHIVITDANKHFVSFDELRELAELEDQNIAD